MKSQSKLKTKKPTKPDRRPALRTPPVLSLNARRELAEKLLNRLGEANPNPLCELYYQTPFQLLVSVVLSAQATDKSVNACMKPLYENGFEPDTVIAMGSDGLLKKIRTIGLAPTKAKNVFKLSKIIIDKFGGKIPRAREDLESLPGVGRKTANVILGEIYREPVLAVDTHVFRVSARLGLQRETTPEKAELALLKVIPPRLLPDGHHWFILHGRYTCKAQAPECNRCILRDLCPSVREEKKKEKEKVKEKK